MLETSEADDTVVMEDEDTDFNDDESWSSFTSAKSVSPSQADIIARHDTPGTPLAKIDESKELKQGDGAEAGPIVPHECVALFISNDNALESPVKK